MKSRNIIPVFIPHCGCPHDCAFCNQKKITQQQLPLKEDEIVNSIEEYLEYFGKDKETQIAFYGGSFTGIPREEMIRYLEIGGKYIKSGQVDSLRLSTRPDYIDGEILKILAGYNVKTIELGVQSMADDVLKANQRGHSSKDVETAVEIIRNYPFELGLQMMIGLYNDSLKSAFFSASKITDLSPDFVRIYPTLVLDNTYLETLFRQGKFNPLTVEEAVEILKKILPLFYQKDIPIIRVGLQPTAEIQEGKSVIAGPFHPGIRSLAEEELYYEYMNRRLKDFEKITDLDFYTPHEYLNYTVGMKKRNKIRFLEEYGLKRIGFKGENRKDFEIIINNERSIHFFEKDIYNRAIEKAEVI